MNWFSKISQSYPKVNPNSINFYQELFKKYKTDSRNKKILFDLIDKVNLYNTLRVKLPVMSQQYIDKFRKIQQSIHNMENMLNIPFEYRAFNSQKDIKQREQENQKIHEQYLKNRKDCNLKILELDQWSATAENIDWTNLMNFDPDLLFGGDSSSIRNLGLNDYEIKYVCPNESPSLGKVWLKEKNNRLQIWKTNYASD